MVSNTDHNSMALDVFKEFLSRDSSIRLLPGVGEDASLDEGEVSKHITFLAAAVPVGGHVHARLGLGRAVGLGYVEGRRAARGGVVPRGGKGDAVLAGGGGVGVGGFCRDGDCLGRGGGLGAWGWGGGAGCGGGGAVGAFRVGCAGASGCCDAVLCGICCRICVGAVFSFGCVAARGVGLRLLPGCCPRLMVSAMAAMAIIAPAMDAHEIAQSR